MAVNGVWYTDQEKPGIQLEHLDSNGTSVVDLSSGYTFTVELVRGTSIVTSQTTNCTGAATSPNFTMSEWSSSVLTAVASDLTSQGVTSCNYDVRVYARANSKDEVLTANQPYTAQFKQAAA